MFRHGSRSRWRSSIYWFSGMASSLMRLGSCPSRWLSLVCKILMAFLGLSETNTIGYYQCAPWGIGMARHPRRAWSSRRTQDDQRPTPTSSAAVVAQQGVLLPIHLQRQDAERVTIDLASATIPESPG